MMEGRRPPKFTRRQQLRKRIANALSANPQSPAAQAAAQRYRLTSSGTNARGKGAMRSYGTLRAAPPINLGPLPPY